MFLGISCIWRNANWIWNPSMYRNCSQWDQIQDWFELCELSLHSFGHYLFGSCHQGAGWMHNISCPVARKGFSNLPKISKLKSCHISSARYWVKDPHLAVVSEAAWSSTPKSAVYRQAAEVRLPRVEFQGGLLIISLEPVWVLKNAKDLLVGTTCFGGFDVDSLFALYPTQIWIYRFRFAGINQVCGLWVSMECFSSLNNNLVGVVSSKFCLNW